MKSYAVLGAAALISSAASAGFTGVTVTEAVSGGRTVSSIWANFSSSTDRILNVFDYMNGSGTMGALHTDSCFGDVDTDGDTYADVFGATGGWATRWNTSTGVPSDSFLFIGGPGGPGPEALDPGFTGPYVSASIANGSGWYDSTPNSPNLAGASLKIKVMQIARLTGSAYYTGNFTVGFAALGSTTAQFGAGTFTIGTPAPGAVALLGLAGLVSRRRRA